ncbi:UNVERIFIED_CONTAM: hypothetical protein PYX00_009945 [Menopon gallinae]|uniref:Peptidase S1 domain-containing protein n=1 Tax=Menopon gallinae TaxID=328185 RepID=A0AAW2HD94_9NEOP
MTVITPLIFTFYVSIIYIFPLGLANYGDNHFDHHNDSAKFRNESYYFHKITRVYGGSSVPKIKVRPPSCEESWHTDATPFVAMILYKHSGRLLCMGSIVDKYHILSVKRCFDRITVETLIIVAGYFRPYWGKNSQVKYVEKIIRHDKELALLRLSRRLLFNEFVKPAILPGPKSRKLTDITRMFPPPYGVIGVPVIRWDAPGDRLPRESHYLLKDEHYTDPEDCKKEYEFIHTDFNRMFCTNGNASFCWGCLGAPTVALVGEELVQIGVVYATNCTKFITPIVHVRTDVHDKWIRSNSYMREFVRPTNLQ